VSLTPNADLILTIEKPVAGGRMLARHEGQVVLVAGAIPGERVRARVERVSKQLAFAEAVEVLDASPDRRDPGVDWACGGSLYAHISYERQLALKSELIVDAFGRIGKIELPLVPIAGSKEDGYRMRARLRMGDGRFAFFREGSHDLCDAGPTRQLLPATSAALTQLETAIRSQSIAGVTTCELSENAAASERAVLLEIDPAHTAPLSIPAVDGITGVLFTDHQSSRLTVGYGSPYVVDRIDVGGAEATLTHHVQSFFQGNRYLLKGLAERVLAQVPAGDVTELYAGVGLFAVSLAAAGRTSITAVEGDRSSAHDLEANAGPYGAAILVQRSSVERYLLRRDRPRPATLILDPPRTGMSREAMAGILGLRAPRLVYVSCDLATVARDVKRFTEAGYRIEHIEALDLFPNTAHVETLIVLKN
jgi:23S rRNA (uracil1939-C5)-methyltransferase